jgi:hypothetical protein
MKTQVFMMKDPAILQDRMKKGEIPLEIHNFPPSRFLGEKLSLVLPVLISVHFLGQGLNKDLQNEEKPCI